MSLRIFGYTLLAIASLYVIIFVARLVMQKRRPHPYNIVLGALTMAYPFGCGFKYGLIGPDWLRHYLADIGFPVAIGYALYLYGSTRIVDDLLAHLRLRKRTVIAAFLLSIGWETFSGLSAASGQVEWPGGVNLTGGFDPLDVVMYTLGTTVALTTLFLWRRWYVRLLQQFELSQQRLIEARRRKRQAIRAAQLAQQPAPNRSARRRKKRKR